VLNAAARNARSWKLDGNDSAAGMLIEPGPLSKAPGEVPEE
jgi:hypothetical protein